MPTSPEVRQGTGFIGFAEIDGELETEKGGNTDGYVRISGKVAIDTQTECVYGQPFFQAAERVRVGEDRSGEMQGYVIGKDDFLDEPA